MLQAQYADSGHQHHFTSRAASHDAAGRGPFPQASFTAVGTGKYSKATQPVQRALDQDKFNEKVKWGATGRHMTKKLWLRIEEAIRMYNKAEYKQNKKKIKTDPKNYLHGQLEWLDKIEHEIYKWFDTTTGKTTADENRPGMFALLDEVQAEHRKVIGQLVQSGTPLWVHDNVDDEQQNDINDTWNRVVTGTGGFSYIDRIGTSEGLKDLPGDFRDAFHNDLHAQVARLMSRPAGRKLVKSLVQKANENKGVGFGMHSLYSMLGTTSQKEKIPPEVGAASTEEILNYALLTQEDYIDKKTKKPETWFAPNQGSGSEVRFTPGIRDSAMMDFDKQNKPILSPQFIGMGHELIHSQHYLNGVYLGPKSAKSKSAKGLPGHYHRGVEEFFTIADEHERMEMGKVSKGVKTAPVDLKKDFARSEKKIPYPLYRSMLQGMSTEAEIRREHGLSIRHGHSTTANPYRYGGQEGWDAETARSPGNYVMDGIEWMKPYYDLEPMYPPNAPKNVEINNNNNLKIDIVND